MAADYTVTVTNVELLPPSIDVENVNMLMITVVNSVTSGVPVTAVNLNDSNQISTTSPVDISSVGPGWRRPRRLV